MAGPDRERIRRDFPECVAFADEFRAVFGHGVKVVYLAEGGRELGQPSRGEGVSVAQMNLNCPEPAPEPKEQARRSRNGKRR